MSDLDKAKALLRRFLEEGEYNDNGDYVLTSDTPASGTLPDSSVPAVVAAAEAFLRGEEPMYFIKNQSGEFWSNQYGWVEADGRDLFTQRERDTLNLPIGGEWEKH